MALEGHCCFQACMSLQSMQGFGTSKGELAIGYLNLIPEGVYGKVSRRACAQSPEEMFTSRDACLQRNIKRFQ